MNRLSASLVAFSSVAALGGLIAYWPSPVPIPLEAPASSKQAAGETGLSSNQAHALEKRRAEVKARFDQGAAMLHAKRYDYALTAFHRVLELAPDIPEAHVNLGFTLLGMQRHKEALAFFESATVLRPWQANAYYGMAEAMDAMGDRSGAIGAMRTFVHLAQKDNPFVSKANIVLSRWDEQRSRKPEKSR
jgi:tetratricopeptide (TPR) repeat protein